MKWACEFSKDAEADLEDLPKAIQKRVARVIAQMATDPFQGNVKALQGGCLTELGNRPELPAIWPAGPARKQVRGLKWPPHKRNQEPFPQFG